MSSSTKSLLMGVATGLLAVGLFFAGFFTHQLTSDDSASGSTTTTGQPTAAAGGKVDMAKLVDDDPSQGPKNAKVTIVEFSDFQCPYCSRGAAVVDQIIETYGDQVRFVFRDFPLDFHELAMPAALAANCANEQGKFWEYYDLAFDAEEGLAAVQNAVIMDVVCAKASAQGLDCQSSDQAVITKIQTIYQDAATQAEINEKYPAKMQEVFNSYPEKAGLDQGKFDECFASKKYQDEVEKDQADGTANGVKGTPAFFVNGQYINGAQPFENFKPIIDAELAK